MENSRFKFRAWDEQNKIMHNEVEFIRSGTEKNDWILFKSDKQKLECGNVLNNPYFQQQINIMQYTGFKIKNIEIYENDIIRARKDYLYKVVFENGSFVLYHLNKYDGQELIRWGLLSRFFDSDMKDILEKSEIIGNIYENPELLKGNK